jgi:hypothetical protein
MVVALSALSTATARWISALMADVKFACTFCARSQESSKGSLQKNSAEEARR